MAKRIPLIQGNHGYRKLTTFDSDIEACELYVERLGHYLKADAISRAEQKSSIPFSVSMPKIYKLIRNELAPVKPGALEDLTTLVKTTKIKL